jgi:D-3-phosphoglycerate dehydrogenase
VGLALRGELALNALNVDIGRELSDVIRPFLPLAESLGGIFTAIAGGPQNQVQLSYLGQIASYDVRVLSLAALKGMFTSIVQGPVSYVNAPLLAAEHGLSYLETKSPSARNHTNLIEIRGDGDAAVAGTLVGLHNEPRFVRLFDFELEIPPARYMCFVRYEDRPGVIGVIGTILGHNSINIADMRNGRRAKGGEALMCLTTDQAISPVLLTELAKASGAKDVRFIELPGYS